MSDPSGSTAFTYDAFGQVVQEVRTVGAQAHTVGYAYDAAGRLAAMTYPSGRSVTYARDGEGRITSVSTRQDALSPVEDVATNMAWQPFGPLQSLGYGNGLTLWKTFDQDYRLDRLLVEDVGVVPSVVFMDRTHGYQDDMNLTHVWDGVNAANDQTFWYTATNRLQNADGAWGDLTFYYDANGNRTHRILDQGGSVETKVFSYPSTSNLIFDVETDAVVTRTFAHDAAGNMSADTRGAVAYQYGYNANNRLESVSTGGLTKGTYVYNAFEQLVSRTRVNMSPAGTIHLIHDRDGNVIAETDGAGNTVREYVWLAQNDGDVALPLAVVSDVNTATPVTYFVHADHLNRPVLMTDSAKQVVWSASYLPFGGEYQISGPAALDARFPGQWFQLESGLSYNWHRHYDASLGRYTQPDPLGFVDGPSRYAYALSNPLKYVDLLGQQAVPAPVNIGGRLLAAGAAAAADGPAPVGDIIAAGILIYTVGELLFGDTADDDEKCGVDCEELYRSDTQVCNQITKRRGAGAGARCHQTAAARYGACLAGKPLPPFDTWNN